MDMCQIDLVIMEKRPSKWYNNKTYSYVLNIMDVFSRYISLKPLQSKESLEVASQIRQIFFSFGIGNVIQCDCLFNFTKKKLLKIGDDESGCCKYRSFVPIKGPRKLCILINPIVLQG